MGIRIVVISGSVRPNNFTEKALAIVIDELKKESEISVDVITPSSMKLPLPGMGGNADVEELKKKVSQATGVILATPEYHGSYSSVIKLIIENLGFPSVLSGKTISLLGVAAGQIGAIKSLEHLRSVCSHVGGIVLPNLVSIADVQKYFDAEGNCQDEDVEKRLRGVATNILHYIRGHICPKITLEAMMRSKDN